jgi:ribosome biogenesis protein SSF1/2
MVVRRGKLGRSAWQLVDDLRDVMQPNTARKLKERKTNSIKDYVSAAGPLGVTHIMAMSQTDLGPTLRIGRLPNGPTLTFKVMRYALSSHVRAAQRRPCDPTDRYGMHW